MISSSIAWDTLIESSRERWLNWLIGSRRCHDLFITPILFYVRLFVSYVFCLVILNIPSLFNNFRLKLQNDIIIYFVYSAMGNLSVGESVFEWVELLEKSIYDQGSLLFPKTMKKQSSLTGDPNIPSNLWKKMSFWAELIVPAIIVQEIPYRDCWKKFVQDLRLSAVVSQAWKNFRK